MNAPNPHVGAAHRERIDALRLEVGRHFLGPQSAVDLLMVALLARGHALIEGVPGVAKTTLMKSFAAALGCSMRRIQFTPDLLPADITGTFVFSPRDGTFTLRAGPVFAHVVLADEVNRAPAKTQSALLEAMQERQVTIEGERYALPNPFFVVATQNPVEMEGTYPLPEAQIDRFLVSIPLGYPSRDDEKRMLRTYGVTSPASQPVLAPDDVIALQEATAAVHVDEDLIHYVVELTRATRKSARVMLGASPRASLGLLQAAKAHAFCAGRTHLSPDDVRAVAVSVLAHRLLVDEEGEEAPRVRRQVVEELVARTDWRRPSA